MNREPEAPPQEAQPPLEEDRTAIDIFNPVLPPEKEAWVRSLPSVASPVVRNPKVPTDVGPKQPRELRSKYTHFSSGGRGSRH